MSKSSDPPADLNKSHLEVLKTIPSGWMLRECHSYHQELKACKSMKGRLHQYYVDGSFTDCSKWEENHRNLQLIIIFS